MTLLCYEVEPGRVALRAAEHRRPWMDDTHHRFAYRCLPLVDANAHGWEMLNPAAFTATWNGGSNIDDVSITFSSERGPDRFVESHFGHGILTFNPKIILRTEPGYAIWMSGPPNALKDGIAPLTAVIDSDWMPYTFSMNWGFTRKRRRVTFEKGEPIGFFFPIERGALERCEPRLIPLAAEPTLQAQYADALFERNLGAMADGDSVERFQGWYAKGAHRVRPKDFT
jgi:hypothetical protein